MKLVLKGPEDLQWMLAHTRGFLGGHVTDVHFSKRRLFDEGSSREVLVGTSVTTVIRYHVRGVTRVAKLTMNGVSDFSIFEQEGADCSTLSSVQAEATGGKFRFWFDPQGELYVVCDEVQFDEASIVTQEAPAVHDLTQWAFQADAGAQPTIEWVLDQLDRAGLPCAWRAVHHGRAETVSICEGDLVPASVPDGSESPGVRMRLYGPYDGAAFGVVLRSSGRGAQPPGRILGVLADLITRAFPGTCLIGDTVIPGVEWRSWRTMQPVGE